MGWNQKKYERAKEIVEEDIKNDPEDYEFYLVDYGRMIDNENYEAAKAITDVLATIGHKTIETHK